MESSLDRLFIAGPVGQLEVLFAPANNINTVAIICHPHPLYSGDMHNKVVTTVASACQDLEISTVRFNFRGVGQSEGHYANGSGEHDDLLAVVSWVQQRYPKADIFLVGFSFGAYVAASVVSVLKVRGLILIAPPISNFPFQDLSILCPLVVLQGEQDEVVDCAVVDAWFQSLNNPAYKIIFFPQTSHFFHGKILELRTALKESIAQILQY